MSESIQSHARALETLWKECQVEIKKPKNWLKRLWLSRTYNLNFIHYKDVSIQIPFGKIPDCELCLESCCTGKNAIVRLRFIDIAKLIDRNLESYIDRPKRLAILKAQKKIQYAPENWAKWEAEKSNFAEIFPLLKRDPTGTCTLLDQQGNCSAYPNWPLSCARYPYSFNLIHKELFWAQGCRSYKQMTLEHPPENLVRLKNAAIDGYNHRIKDIYLLHFKLKELHDLKLLKFLDLNKKLKRKLIKLKNTSSA